jgi:MarR family transcriptional repressor of emrRAB
MLTQQLTMVEASVERLALRLGSVPVSEVMLTRLVLLLSHELAALLTHHIRPYGLAEGEFRVLTTLFSQPNGSSTPSELCGRASQSPANMSRICDALVERQLITRDSSRADRRKMVLQITPNGEELVRQLLPNLFAALRRVFQRFPAEEQGVLAAQMKRIALGLEEAMQGSPAAHEPGWP